MARVPPKTHVTINMAMSVDGKISTWRRESIALGSPEDRHTMDVLRAKSDAVIIGSRTLALDGWPVRVRDREIRLRRSRRGLPPHPLNVVMSTALEMSPRCQFFRHPKTQKLVITTRAAPQSRIRRFAQCAEVLVLPGKRVRPGRVVDVLHSRGMNRILVEGGGELNFSFFKEGLVDELFITITPRVLGGSAAPTPVDGRGFLSRSQIPLELVSSRRRGDEVFLRYRVVNR